MNLPNKISNINQQILKILAMLLLYISLGNAQIDSVTNFGKVQVSAGYNSTATTIILRVGDGVRLPISGYNLVWWNVKVSLDPSDDVDREIVRVTARSGDTLTIIRGQEGITAKNHNTAFGIFRMILSPTKKTIDDIRTHLFETGYAFLRSALDTIDVTIINMTSSGYVEAHWADSTHSYLGTLTVTPRSGKFTIASNWNEITDSLRIAYRIIKR